MFNYPNNTRSVNVADLFGNIAQQLGQDRNQINQLDAQDGNGNHGDNMQANFEMIANLLRQGQNQGLSAPEQLRRAADTLEQQGRGGTAPLYAEGLREASTQIQGQDGIGLDDLGPLLNGLLGGIQRRTNAQPGQGSMIDVLMPAITGFMGARSSGRSGTDAIMQALQAATSGSQQQYNTPAQWGQGRRNPQGAWRDPGASSAQSVLQGLFRSFTG